MMTKTNVLTKSRYSRLLGDIRKLIEEGRRRATRVANQELLQTYWKIGRRVSEESLIDNAGYGEAILQDLSDELNVDIRTLQRSIDFFHKYNTATSSRNLTWSHYKYLLSINDDQERKWYEQNVDRQRWNVLQLGKAIKEGSYEQSQKGKGKKAHTPALKRPTEATYVYKAIVERVIDGDTLLLRIDLGFQVFKEQRVRLAEIDTPSMDQPKGKEACQYVRDQLARVNFVMVKTNKIDVYGRYVGHVFYSTKNFSKNKIFSSGRYLNQELVQKKLARIL